MLVLHSAVV